MTRRASFAPLAERQFRYFFLSRAVNLTGSMMAPVALAFAVLAVEDSASALGQVLAARNVPMVVFLLIGGVIADRVDRRLVIQVSNVVSALSQACAAYLVITGQAELWHLVAIEAVNGTSSAAAFPAMQGMIPQLVPRTMLQPANVLLSMARGGLAILGPTVAAVLVVLVGPGWALAVDATTWLVAAALLLPVRLPRRTTAPTAGVVHDLREGWTLFRSTTWLWVVVLGFGVLNAIHAGAWNTLGPAVAKETIGIRGWGYVVSAESVGLLLATAVLLRVSFRFPLRAGMLGCLVFSAPLLMLGLDPHLLPLTLGIAAAGAGFEVFGLGWNLAMQENVPEELLSRAYSYDALGSFVAIPVGQLLYGSLGDWLGLQTVLVGSAVAYAAVCLLTLTSSSVRNLEHRLAEREPALSTTSPPSP
ncbi:MFS transporter [Nocardioides guangzhouensis]|uniref:MFS transporter n=1 Tax=Nocardioides guangzhouensis TaxID=2497878 RepID=A0A4Q4ZAJ7_9ACTN|nr:MFS transporter [Nocardioides guangzhouensis]RYP84124.1 MFS transporter [Nocardioides guangzhouensis]